MINNAIPTVSITGGQAIGGVMHMTPPDTARPAPRPASRNGSFLDGIHKSRGQSGEEATTGAEATPVIEEAAELAI